MTLKERVALANVLLGGDIAQEAELRLAFCKDLSEHEKSMAVLISQLYKLLHPAGTCKNPHHDWEAENEKLLLKLQHEL